MRVVIISDGTPENTRVADAETGEILENVYGISWVLVNGHAAATITLMDASVQLEADAIAVPRGAA